MSTAIVVGSGPNGLACAAALARRGRRGDGARGRGDDRRRHPQQRADGPGPASTTTARPCTRWRSARPFLRSLDLERHGLEWRWPEVDLAHPLDDGSAAVMVRSIEETAAGLGEDGRAWQRLFGSPRAHFDALNEDIMRPILHLPRHPLRLRPLRAAGGGAGDAARPRAGRRRRRGRCSAASPPTPSAR